MDLELTSFLTVTDAADYCVPFINSACDTKRRNYVPDNSQSTHQLIYQQAVAYVLATYPFADVNDYGFVLAAAQNYAGTPTPTSTDVQTIADALKDQGDAYYGAVGVVGILPAIEYERGRIVDLYVCPTPPDCLALTTNIIESVNSIS